MGLQHADPPEFSVCAHHDTMTHLEFSVCAHHDTLTHPEFSVRASPHGPSPVARVFSPLPGSRSALGVTSPTCPRSKAWTLHGCDPSGAQGALSLCLCEARTPAAQGALPIVSSLEPGLVHAGTRLTLGQELTHISTVSPRKLL